MGEARRVPSQLGRDRVARCRGLARGGDPARAEFESQPGGRLARLAAQVMVGDTLSLYLALARGVDPTPVASIDEFKRRLAEARPKREC
ncbi:MAG: hypothetical protein E6K78_12675 [Candidatus Eisenbacteria bacterium]|uniref:Bifunctional glucose-6-phosphate/mannose-6-phosphate isomerase C-terminal domain-containing protein n=1 Tax=Eiseniibacteriota bacterium TaxID=2212470 RepID=A0A538TD47_UNCEI|nr:MAG: hypothetical protein E6K78_12675 [Candidatus Eisenbacteria bacterium]